MKVWITLFMLWMTMPCFTQPVSIDFDALQQSKPWSATEQWEPEPARVTPGVNTSPPSDAVVLFDGKDLMAWHTPKYDYGTRMDQVVSIIEWKETHPEFSDPQWLIKDGQLIVNPGTGAIETKQSFGSVQLHIEWLAPVDPGKESQGYSNSGIFFMGLYEIQILNSYENRTYSNGQAGAMYKQFMPLVNASRPPGEWQSYDIIFMAPSFDKDGDLKQPAYVTAFQNGILIQNHVELRGPCIFIGEPSYFKHADKLPLLLQDHGDRVRYRNIWIREL
ncbi:MAG: DUF1080 domain-containing protein [Saprospiraceae bacterium]|nr:DUF1080 domain-containing protein [Saprospiraceae bacterium]